MGFWQGVQQGVEIVKEDELNAETMRLANLREERAVKVFERGERESHLDFLKKTRDLINPSAIRLPSMKGSKSSSSGGALTNKRMMNDLMMIGVKSEDLMKVMSNAGTPAASNRMLSKIHTRAIDYEKGLGSNNFVETTPTGEAMGALISDAIFSASEETILDDEWWKATEENLEMVFFEDQRNSLYPSGKIITGGGLTFTRDLNLTEFASIPDTKAARGVIEDITVDIAAKVLGKIQTLQGDFNVKGQNNIELTAQEVKLKKYMDEQTTILFDAIEAKDVNTLGRLYGNEATALLLKTNRGLVPGLLPPEYNKENQARLFFADRELLFLVDQAGLLNKGQIVSYYLRDDNDPNKNGELVTKVIGEE